MSELRITLSIQSDAVSRLLEGHACDEDDFPSCDQILFAFLEPYTGFYRDQMIVMFNSLIEEEYEEDTALLAVLALLDKKGMTVSIDTFPRLVKPPRGEGPMTIEQHKDRLS